MNPITRRVLATTCLALGVGWGTAGFAAHETDPELLTLIDLMQTDIAVKTDLQDEDTAPGIVAVLRGEDLLALGIRTVSQALTLVAGFDTTNDGVGLTNPSVRGVGGVLASASGKIKYLLNGIAINSTLSANGDVLLRTPIWQVKRIEIIRGPGSVLHGEYALSGVVNVVTIDRGSRIGFGVGSHGMYGGTGTYSRALSPDTHISISVSGSHTDGDSQFAGPDNYGFFGQTNELQAHYDLIFKLSHKSTRLTLQHLRTDNGVPFGVGNHLDPDNSGVHSKGISTNAEVRHAGILTSNLEIEGFLGLHRLDNEFRDALLTPLAFGGLEATTYYTEERYYGGVEATWRGWEKHVVLLGLTFSHTRNFDIYAINNFDPTTGFPLGMFKRFPGSLASLPSGSERETWSLYLQDQISVNDALQVVLGIRMDDYSDVGVAITPRAALVYQPSPEHVFKAQYAEAFRPPTFVELTSVVASRLGNPDMEPERSRTIELGYIYRRPDTVFRLTLFRVEYDDLIVLDGNTYANSAGASSRGAEAEIEHSFGTRLKIIANVSYADTKDDATGKELTGSAKWLANLAVIARPRPNMSIGGRLRYVGERAREAGDTRPELDAQTVFDLTLSWFNVGVPGLTLRTGVSNLFDADITHPSPTPSPGPPFFLPNTYLNDYPRPGRTFWGQAIKEF